MIRNERSHLGEQGLIPIGVIWWITVVIGLLLLFNYQTASSSTGNLSNRWPVGGRIVSAVDHVYLSRNQT